MITIDKFDLGMKTNGDLLDSGKFGNIENFETDKPGMAYRRDAQLAIQNGGHEFKQIQKWSHDEKVMRTAGVGVNWEQDNGGLLQIVTTAAHYLKTGDRVRLSNMNDAAHDGDSDITYVSANTFVCDDIAFSSGGGAGGTVEQIASSGWFIHGIVGANDYIHRYYNTLYSIVKIEIKDFGASTSETCKIIPFDREIRFANGQSRKAGLYQYIDRDYFWNSGIKTVDLFDYDDAEIRNSELSYTLTVTDETGSGGELDLSANTYYYKVVAVFDNGQECPLPDRFYSTASSAASSTVILTIAVDFSSWNERITQIKIYRCETAFGTYKLVKTVDTRDTTSDTNVTYASDANVGRGLHDSSKSWTTDEHATRILIIENTEYTISSNSSDVLVVSANIDTDEALWNGHYTIWPNGTTFTLKQDMEDGTTGGWAPDGGGSVASSTDFARSGTKALKFTINANGEALIKAEVMANTSYVVTAWVYTEDAGVTKIGLDAEASGFPSEVTIDSTTRGVWQKLEKSITLADGTLNMEIIVTDASNDGVIYVDDVFVSNNLVSSDSGTAGYAGRDVIISDANYDYDTDSRQNWRTLVGKSGAGGGNEDTTAQRRMVANNHGKALKADNEFSGDSLGVSLEAYLCHNYIWQKTNTNEATLYFYDQGEETLQHYLRGKEKITTNYKYGVYINGRMYGLYVRLDPDGEAEDHADLIVFSEFDMPDVLPIVNAIRIQDLQGGVITGGVNMNGDLVVFAENGVYVLRVPSVDPTGWELTNPIKNIGCIAPNSIESAEGVTFFAGKDYAYALTPDYQAYELTLDILDEYQGSANLENSEFRYDPIKKRLLCKFGDTIATTWALDLKKWFADGTTAWTKITTTGNYRITKMAIDENLQMYSFYTYATQYYANYLYDQANGLETFVPILKTGIYSLSKMSRSVIIRYLNLGYDSSDLLIAKIFLDRESSASVSYTASTIAFVASTPPTITDTGDLFVSEGFNREMKLICEGSTNNDDQVFNVRSIAEDTLTLAPDDSVTAEAAGSSFVLDEVVEFPANNSSGDKHTSERVSDHAVYGQVEIKPLANNTTTLEIFKIEIE